MRWPPRAWWRPWIRWPPPSGIRWGGPAPTASAPGGDAARHARWSGPRPAPSRSGAARPGAPPDRPRWPARGPPAAAAGWCGAGNCGRQAGQALSSPATQPLVDRGHRDPWASAARAGGQPCSQTRSTSSRRPATVSFALGWAMRASSLSSSTVLSPEALTLSTTCLGPTPSRDGCRSQRSSRGRCSAERIARMAGESA